jgi:hypothetical protein
MNQGWAVSDLPGLDFIIRSPGELIFLMTAVKPIV